MELQSSEPLGLMPGSHSGAQRDTQDLSVLVPLTLAQLAPPLPPLSVKEAEEIIGGLSSNKKMPGPTYDLDPDHCRIGAKLRNVPGSECAICYACRGNRRRPTVRAARERHLRALDHPRWAEAMAVVLNDYCRRKPPEARFFRWHSSGDLQSVEHLRAIVRVAELVPDVRFWLQTKEIGDVRHFLEGGGQLPGNLAVRISSAIIGKPRPVLGLPISTITARADSHPPEAFGCPATEPASEGACGPCRACWDKDVSIVAFREHGSHADPMKRFSATKPPAHQQEHLDMNPIALLPVPAATGRPAQKSETRVSDSGASPKLSRQAALDLDARIVAGLAEDRSDEVRRKLMIAPDVALMTMNGNFRTIGYKSKEKYFKSRCESKPYLLALERIGKADVEAIQALADEYQMSWKRLQLYTSVEHDPGKLVAFIEKTLPGHQDMPFREFEKYLKSVRHPVARSGAAPPRVASGAAQAMLVAQPPHLDGLVASVEQELARLVASPDAGLVLREEIIAAKLKVDVMFDRALDALDGDGHRPQGAEPAPDFLTNRAALFCIPSNLAAVDLLDGIPSLGT